MKYLLLLFVTLGGLLSACNSDSEKRFDELPANKTGIDFINRSLDKKNFNIFNYRNFYNGGGVAIGDVNGDGLPDVFLTSNFEQNKLYLNQGQMTFKDITLPAGITQKKFWSTGVTMADVNGDGRLDIYVCNSGSRDERGNQLYINQGNKQGVPVFVEQAKEYGLFDGGFSTHAAFLDYDRDGDLDMYLLNNSFTPMDRLQYANLRERRDNLGGDKLFRNDGKHFTDVSEEAGIYGSLIGFGLGITIGDVNNDNWPDIYISNDFYERDYLYINQQNGKFKESLESYMEHSSLASMGADIADVNNDGNLDIFVTDMLPDDDYRLKTTTSFDTYDLTRLKEQRDFWHQDSRNMFHMNNGDGTFSEVGRLANVHATDWSWGALLFDMDMDGYKDIFVANGILKDLTDQDYVAFLSDNPDIQDLIEGRKQFDYKEYVNKMGSTPLANYAFRNKGDGLQFENEAAKWGLGKPNFSNGSAYGDLDNDGDLDLVVNNNDAPVSVYQNRSVERFKTNYLRVQLLGGAGNRNAIGAKVFVYQHDEKRQVQMQYLQQMPNRGFQSSVDLTLVFGLGANPVIDSVRVIWSDRQAGMDLTQGLTSPKANQTLLLDQRKAQPVVPISLQKPTPVNAPAKLFSDATVSSGLSFTHIENDFVDYNRDGTLKQMLSREGPALAVGDVNGDGLDDVYFGGAAGQVRALYLQQPNGTYRFDKQPFLLDANYTEDVAATFFDADGDKDLDLYVATGGNEFTDIADLADRLFINDGHGHFTWDKTLPRTAENNSCVVAADVDLDGDQDLFVGSRMVSGQYGKNPEHTLLINDGNGHFRKATKDLMPSVNEIGMVTSAVWADVDNDHYPDLVLAGDWMPITVLHNRQGKGTAFRGFERLDDPTLAKSGGWWNTIQAADLDGDGDTDFVLGNLGLNSRMVASPEKPARLYGNDFDHNGTFDPVMSCFRTGLEGDSHECLMMQKPDLQRQIPSIKQKFLKHTDYAKATLNDLFTDKQREGMIVREVQLAQSVVLLNDYAAGGKGGFTIKPLPLVAQESPVHGIVIQDFTGDSRPDLLIAGNFFDVLTELGRYDANYGLLLTNVGRGEFRPVAPAQSGFFSKGQVRNMAVVHGTNGREQIVLAKNNDRAQVFSVNRLTKGLTRGK